MTTSYPSDDEQLSERFDCETTLNDLPESSKQLVQKWQQLGECIRSVPVSPASVADSVRMQLDRDDVAVALVTGSSDARGWTVRGRSSIALTTAAMTIVFCCVALWMLPPPASVPAIAKNLSSTFTSQQLATGFANCDVVVVTMPEGKEEASDWIQSSFAAHGMHAQAILVDSRSQDAQVSRIVGTDVASEDFLDLMNTFDNEYRPLQIDEMEPDELISQFVESLETPSLAEEHFNEFVVVVPKDLLQQLRSGQAAAAAPTSLAAATEETTAPTIESQTLPPAAAPRPVVFVIRRRQADAHPAIDGVHLQLDAPWSRTKEQYRNRFRV